MDTTKTRSLPIRNKVMSAKKYSCRECSSYFNETIDYINHIRTHHPKNSDRSFSIHSASSSSSNSSKNSSSSTSSSSSLESPTKLYSLKMNATARDSIPLASDPSIRKFRPLILPFPKKMRTRTIIRSENRETVPQMQTVKDHDDSVKKVLRIEVKIKPNTEKFFNSSVKLQSAIRIDPINSQNFKEKECSNCLRIYFDEDNYNEHIVNCKNPNCLDEPVTHEREPILYKPKRILHKQEPIALEQEPSQEEEKEEKESLIEPNPKKEEISPNQLELNLNKLKSLPIDADPPDESSIGLEDESTDEYTNLSVSTDIDADDESPRSSILKYIAKDEIEKFILTRAYCMSCQECHLTFYDQESYLCHEPCYYNSKLYDIKSDLKFGCNFCEHKYRDRKSLIEHMNCHLYDRFVCRKCHFTTYHRIDMEIHVLDHLDLACVMNDSTFEFGLHEDDLSKINYGLIQISQSDDEASHKESQLISNVHKFDLLMQEEDEDEGEENNDETTNGSEDEEYTCPRCKSVYLDRDVYKLHTSNCNIKTIHSMMIH